MVYIITYQTTMKYIIAIYTTAVIQKNTLDNHRLQHISEKGLLPCFWINYRKIYLPVKTAISQYDYIENPFPE